MLITGCLPQNEVNVGICCHPHLFNNSCAQHLKINNFESQYPIDIWFIKSQLNLQNKRNTFSLKGQPLIISPARMSYDLLQLRSTQTCMMKLNNFPPTRVEYGPLCYWMKLAWLQPSWHLDYTVWQNLINYTSAIPWSFNINTLMPSERNQTK
jgi:hypothetical protein